MKSWVKRIAIAAVVLFAVLIAILVIRALMVESMQTSGTPVEVTVDVDESAVAQRLSKVIQTPTVSPTTAEEGAPFLDLHQRLEEYFPRFHEAAERRVVNELTLHFIIEGSNPDASHVVFLAHQDVVPVESGTEGDWTYPPFSGEQEDGFVWGRGALDNKHSLMAILEAAEMWIADGGRPEHTMHFVFGHDEEIGGRDGAKAVAEQMVEDDLDVAAVFDEGLTILDGIVPGIDGPIALVGITERGYLTVEIEASAEGGHSSMPPQELAVYRLAEALRTLEDNPRDGAIDSATEMMLEWAVPEMNFLYRLIFRNLWLTESIVVSQMSGAPSTNASVRTTAAPTMLRASKTENVLPQSAVATVNFRLHPRDTVDDVLGDLEDLLGDEFVTIRPAGDTRVEPNPLAGVEGPAFESIQNALEAVFPEIPVAPGMLVALSDSRHFTGLTDDVYRFTPVTLTGRDLERVHGTNERISVDAYVELIRYYSAMLGQW